MQSPYDESWRVTDTPLWQFISRNLSILVFLLFGAAGMVAVFVYFSPASGVAEVVAAEGALVTHSAAFYKPVPQKPVQQRLAQSPGPVRIGIIAGHKGFDPGAVCADGLTEVEVNESIALQVVAALRTSNIPTDLLDEFDPRLDGYVATGLVSIHADSCDPINDLATGFKIAGSSFTDSASLSICVEDAYRQATDLAYHANTITPHMTDYHVFRKIAPGVPAIILETGFMDLDRELLTTNSQVVAEAIADGLRCYVSQARGGRPIAAAGE